MFISIFIAYSQVEVINVDIKMEIYINYVMELAWRSGNVMDWHATARGSIPGGNRVTKTCFTSFARDSKWGCRLSVTSLSMGRKTQPTNHQLCVTILLEWIEIFKISNSHNQFNP